MVIGCVEEELGFFSMPVTKAIKPRIKNKNGPPIKHRKFPVNRPKATPTPTEPGIHNHRNIAKITFPVFISFAFL